MSNALKTVLARRNLEATRAAAAQTARRSRQISDMQGAMSAAAHAARARTTR